MHITLVKETHPETGRVRYSVEKDGLFVDGTVTHSEAVARRMYEAVLKSHGTTIWQRQIIEQAEAASTN